MQADWEGNWVACWHALLVYVEVERDFNERSRALLTRAPSPRKECATIRRRSLVRALICHLWWTEEVGWCGHQVRMPLCFWRILTQNSAEIVSVLLLFAPAWLVVWLLNLDP